MKLAITFLGTGTSQGIPVIGCDCEVCTSDDPRDKRLRTSAVIHLPGRNILIDTTPDLRTAALNVNLRQVDAIFITHTHADHVLGLDDVRRFSQLSGEPIDLYCSAEDIPRIDKVFGYGRVKEDRPFNPDIPQLRFHAVEGPFELFGHQVEPLSLPHGSRDVLSFRIGALAYCTDVSEMPEWAYERLQGLDTLILGALRPRNHPKHLTIDQAVAVARRLSPRQSYFVHMAHQVSHATVQATLPDGIELAYDGLCVDIEGQ